MNYIIDRGYIKENISRVFYKEDSTYRYFIEIHNLDSNFQVTEDIDCFKSTKLKGDAFIEESGLIFNINKDIHDSVFNINKGVNVKLENIEYDTKMNSVSVNECLVYRVHYLDNPNEYYKYYISADLKLFLKWENYIGDSIYKTMEIQNIEFVNTDYGKDLKCRD